MTLKRTITPRADAAAFIRFPDRPDSFDMTTYRKLTIHGYQAALIAHLGNHETTIVNSEVAAGVRPTASYEGVLFPDLLIAFNVDPAADVARNGYAISEQGKPPDFVLEVASESTGRRDETVKRDAYARMGIPEYWRFDESGGRYHNAPLAGDRLVDGVYVPIPIIRQDDGSLRGRSESLGLYLCWEDGDLRFWNPVSESYLETFAEVIARADADAARADADAARARRLEEELARERQARIEAESRLRNREEQGP